MTASLFFLPRKTNSPIANREALRAAAALAWRLGGSLTRKNGVWHVRTGRGAA